MTFREALIVATEAAQQWAIYDPDPIMRSRVDHMVDARDTELIDLFTGRIAFGTAGLRAQVGPGPNRMNALVVRQTTAAVVGWLQDNGVPTPRVVIGFDARHDSAAFAGHCSAAVTALGGAALRADGWAPTPVFAHALLHEPADAAIVVTASHNPAPDNGYKLYLSDGLQLVSPADAEIADRIDDMASRWHEWASIVDDNYAEIRGDSEARDLYSVDEWVESHRHSAVAALSTTHRDLTVAYTAMHGVGGAPILAAFEAAGFPEPFVVREQFEADPDFPTVPFPNPEESGALDLLAALGVSSHADIGIANDPDADRLAVAVPGRTGGGFVTLSGNELGILLADHALRTSQGGDRIVARSVVSSRQLDALAAAHGVTCVVTLTGFKWVARPIVSYAQSQFVFGFEEAIGYCVGDRVRDKDGVTAALVAAELFASYKAQGTNAWERLDELAAEHGLYVNHPMSLRFDEDPSRVQRLMDRVMESPPVELAGHAVVQSGPVGLGALPPTDGLHLVTDDDSQVIVRPSGTEPKVKAYIEVIQPAEPSTTRADVAAMRAQADERIQALAADVAALLNA